MNKKKIQDWLVYQVVRLTITIFSIVPYKLVQVTASFFSFLLGAVFSYRHTIIKENLRRSFLNKETAFYQQTIKDYYSHLSDLIFETLKAFSLNKTTLQQHFHCTNPEIFTPYLAQGQSCILMGSHHNNWEIACLAFPLQMEFPVFTVYKPLSNTYLNAYLNKLRSKWGMSMVSMQRVGRTIIEEKNKPSVFVFIADQSPASTEYAIWTDFLNRDTPFIHGVEKIADKTQYPVFYFSTVKTKRGYYEAVIQKIARPKGLESNGLTLQYAILLEQEIRKAPAHWLWSHRRWKRSRNLL